MEYVIYKIHFKDLGAIYIGCSSNLVKRREQHLFDVTFRNCRFHRYVRQNNLSNQITLIPLMSFNDRKIAFSFEKRFVQKVANTTTLNVLNENYTVNSRRKGLIGIDNPSSKSFVVANVRSGEVHEVEVLKDFCKTKNLKYKLLHGTSTGKQHLHKDYKCFSINQWENLSEDDLNLLLNGGYEWYMKDELKKKVSSRCKKEYIVLSNTGSIATIYGLDNFAESHGINKGNLHATAMKKNWGKRAGGFRAFKKEDWNKLTEEEKNLILSESKTH